MSHKSVINCHNRAESLGKGAEVEPKKIRYWLVGLDSDVTVASLGRRFYPIPPQRFLRLEYKPS